MNLVPWNPWRDLPTLQNRINRMFSDFFPVDRDSEAVSAVAWSPSVDIIDHENRIELHAELPGVKKEDISIDITGDKLILKGVRSDENEVKKEAYYRCERFHGSFQRTFSLPAEVNHDAIKASYKDGVLKIEIPKPEETQPRQIPIS